MVFFCFMTDFRFTNDLSQHEIDGVVGLLRSPRLWIPTEADYPAHPEWVDKTVAQLESETKRALLAQHDGVPVGVAIFQRHPERSEILEIRNLSVAPEDQGRFVGSFLLRNTEIEAMVGFPGVKSVLVDTKATNTDMVDFLMNHGYEIEEFVDLYGLGTGEDVVLSKSLVSE